MPVNEQRKVPDGILPVYKEAGFTSHDVVASLRGILHTRRIGHTGTLDPMATGVLPVAVGAGTRLAEFLTEKKKTYEAVMRLGICTETQDITGSVLEQSPVNVTEEEIIACAGSFAGEQLQIPPMYSAVKVNGKKLYELAREGKTVERKPRPVTFYEICVTGTDLPEVCLTVTCSKGTYIRTLCHDIGEKLGCHACMEALVRTRSGRFGIEDCYTLPEIREAFEAGRIEEMILSPEAVLSEFPALYGSEEAGKLLLNGNPVPEEMVSPHFRTGRVRMYMHDGRFVGLYEWRSGKEKYFPVKMLMA